MTADVVKELLAHAREEAPREAVGLIVEHSCGLEVWRARNEAESHHHYRMNARDQFRYFRAIAQYGYRLAAIYHSHPRGPAALSDTDKAVWFYRDVALVVVSLEPEAICWFFSGVESPVSHATIPREAAA